MFFFFLLCITIKLILAREGNESELSTTVSLSKGPAGWDNVVGDDCTAVTGGDLEGKALAIEVAVALPVLSPVP